MRGLVKALCGALVAAALLGPAATANAQSDDERARLHFQSGVSYFEQGRYEEALREWQESYRLSNRHVLLMNISQAQERLFQFDEAIQSLQRYLELGGPEAEERRNTIEVRIEALRHQAEVFAARAGGGTPAGTPNETPAETPTETPVETPAETPTETPAETPAETPTETPAETPAETPTEAPAVEPSEGPRFLWSWVALGATGLFGVGAIVTGAMALGIRSDLESQCPNGSCPADLEADGNRMHTLAIVTDVFIGLTAAAAVGTVLAFVFEARAGRSESSARLLPTLGPGHAGLVLTF